MAYETVMGLEVHVELSTKTKIFCGCSTEFGGEPNSHTCPVCLGMPGSLPVLNKEVVEKAVRAGLALNCSITETNIFDRKNYFYPDLPKDYQISQLYYPICRDGWVQLDMGDYTKKVRIHEIHMEEDAGKLIHDAAGSLIDYNRCGVPLIEIVSEPDLRTPEEVAAYLEKLREILVYLDVSDCKMEEGSMRADVNLSIREEGSDELGTRTETKNMNSIKAIQRNIEFEERRQIELIKSGGKVIQQTRRWDDTKGENYAMRSKENAQDYRYFPDPDLIPNFIDTAWIKRTKEGFPELAEEKRRRYETEYGIQKKTAAVLTAEKQYADLFETILTSLSDFDGGDVNTKEENDADAIKKDAREAANIVTGDILRLMKEQNTSPEDLKVDGFKIAQVIKMIKDGKINRSIGKTLVEKIYKNDIEPIKYAEEKGLLMIEDTELLNEVISKVLSDNPQSIADYKSGKKQAFGFLVGQSMKQLKGKASPQAVNSMLQEKLEEEGVDVELSSKATGKTETKKDNNGDDKSKESLIDFDGETGKIAGRSEGEVECTETPKELGWRDKLQEETERPKTIDYKESNRYRTFTCGELNKEYIDKDAKVAGWIHTVRDHGGIVFVDLRDQYGMTQIVVTEEQVKDLHKEMVISVKGKVLKRDEDTINPNITTGDVEVEAEEIELLGPSKSNLPFEIDSSTDTREELRLKYRYLDLRNPDIHDNIILRSEIIKHVRLEMEAMGFTEIQTPILANSSPEGARDYLVPSRKWKGKFYALPQAPQQFKQLLMVSGFDKYFQIAPCFRDEDARQDRSPGEFYQLDFEMAFATQEDVFAVAEQVLSSTFKRFTHKKVSEAPFVRIPFDEAMLKYGTDKPDLRNPLEIIDISDFFARVDFKPFQGKIVRAIRVPDATKMSKKFFKEMEKYALSIGMGGLGYIGVLDDMTYKGPIDKFMNDEQKKEIAKLAGLKPGDVLYFISDEADVVAKYAGEIRTEVAKRLDLIDTDRYEFCYITDFPMYEINEETGEVDFTHNPFSMPQGEMDALMNKNPLDIKAWQYDIVCNGVELSSGAVRNHRPDIMLKAFEIAGYTEKDVEEKFGALYNAFQYGAPPHAGMAPGIDRIIMLLAEEENIREVIAFPLNSNAQNTMLDAPSEVTEQQLREVHIKIR